MVGKGENVTQFHDFSFLKKGKKGARVVRKATVGIGDENRRSWQKTQLKSAYFALSERARAKARARMVKAGLAKRLWQGWCSWRPDTAKMAVTGRGQFT